MRLDAKEVRDAARGRWTDILARLSGGELDTALSRIGRHVPCPRHEKSRDGFRLFRDVAETGGGICNTCGAFNDGFSLLMWLNGWGFREALEEVAAVLGMTNGEHQAFRAQARPQPCLVVRQKSKTRQRRVFASQLERIWGDSVALTSQAGMPVVRYLKSRWLDLPLELTALRCHPALPYREQGMELGRFPCMVARVVSPDGELVTLHRTYLTDDGRKAKVPSVKKLMPVVDGRTIKGAAIRLGQIRPLLGIAEGIETALAVSLGTGMVCWSVIAAPFMECFVPPEGVQSVVIWADRDRSGTGQHAARALRDRLRGMGLSAHVRLPPADLAGGVGQVDWHDIWVRDGVQGFSHELQVA